MSAIATGSNAQGLFSVKIVCSLSPSTSPILLPAVRLKDECQTAGLACLPACVSLARVGEDFKALLGGWATAEKLHDPDVVSPSSLLTRKLLVANLTIPLGFRHPGCLGTRSDGPPVYDEDGGALHPNPRTAASIDDLLSPSSLHLYESKVHLQKKTFTQLYSKSASFFCTDLALPPAGFFKKLQSKWALGNGLFMYV